jgi:hypothetical protein
MLRGQVRFRIGRRAALRGEFFKNFLMSFDGFGF